MSWPFGLGPALSSVAAPPAAVASGSHKPSQGRTSLGNAGNFFGSSTSFSHVNSNPVSSSGFSIFGKGSISRPARLGVPGFFFLINVMYFFVHGLSGMLTQMIRISYWPHLLPVSCMLSLQENPICGTSDFLDIRVSVSTLDGPPRKLLSPWGGCHRLDRVPLIWCSAGVTEQPSPACWRETHSDWRRVVVAS